MKIAPNCESRANPKPFQFGTEGEPGANFHGASERNLGIKLLPPGTAS
jgi:hypothetical protein